RRLMVRLVKGAYWDSEIKRAQERGLDDYPVFTRKAMTDLNFIACAEKLLALRPRIFPQFATHNAQTVATIIERAGGTEGYEFQRLHGMGEALYERLLERMPDAACRIYAPVGEQADLLAYLVRRLLENGANSSFVSLAADPETPIERILKHPADAIGRPDEARHPRLPRPRELYRPARANSAGLELGDRSALEDLLAGIEAARGNDVLALPIIDGAPIGRAEGTLVSPIDGAGPAGRIGWADAETADRAVVAALRGFAAWDGTDAARRAAAFDAAAGMLEARRAAFVHLLQVEAGKTLDDALAEVREAADFCRYYAAEARRILGTDTALPGPNGESNRLRLRGRGAFVAISPWNFPLAIFMGQIAAALLAGNSVVAKPAEQTPLIAAAAVRLLHEAGIPPGALHLVTGDGKIGARLVAHPAIAGVVFTGSTDVARAINRVLAAKDGPIVPLIAETGGINAMIVDATALPEQVADDVVTSAFRSAGQRCSALRLLFLQEDVADRMLRMIAGATAELKLGDPRDPASHIGPVIDREAWDRLAAHVARLKREARLHHGGAMPAGSHLFPPHIFEIASAEALTEEIFGPILHVVRYAAADLDQIIGAIAAKGYGLTLGLHSRIDRMQARVLERLAVGNVYVNRNMIGAVVGSQPFGGHGLSGTGPKAGGPHYLMRFLTEQTITVNTAAIGGDATLISLDG
ncbi:MAG: bifunctional proline dehydrogenase/L-glutamate gamma-semialdehyde dehydrogenase PutA, partial [Alphaproteobacteria bacterium]|nr:bifunctional proline dehydrogenase/L-glutamate gamma-semialdehyde dehydrogenase PutA [Alphaproteobacteria bacterium]